MWILSLVSIKIFKKNLRLCVYMYFVWFLVSKCLEIVSQTGDLLEGKLCPLIHSCSSFTLSGVGKYVCTYKKNYMYQIYNFKGFFFIIGDKSTERHFRKMIIIFVYANQNLINKHIFSWRYIYIYKEN